MYYVRPEVSLPALNKIGKEKVILSFGMIFAANMTTCLLYTLTSSCHDRKILFYVQIILMIIPTCVH